MDGTGRVNYKRKSWVGKESGVEVFVDILVLGCGGWCAGFGLWIMSWI